MLKLFVFLIIPPSLYLALEMSDGLKEVCPRISEIEAEYQKERQDFESKNMELPEDLMRKSHEVQNVDSLVDLLFSGAEPLAEGPNWKVYAFDYKAPPDYEDLPVLTKVVKFKGLQSSETANQQQSTLANEIMANKVVHSQNLGKYFFPELFGCFEFGDKVEAKVQEKNNSDLSDAALRNISYDPEEGMAAVFVEKLTFSLKQLFRSKADHVFSQHQMLNLQYQAIKGLEIMNEHFLHCDIRPENMMLKQMTEDEAREMQEAGIPVARTRQDEAFQLKFVGFGQVAVGEKGQRSCINGTPGFTPDEHLQTMTYNEKFDVYSLGMAFLDLELAKRGFKPFSEVDSIIYKRKQHKKKQFKGLDTKILSKKNIVQKMKTLMRDGTFRPYIMKKFQKVYKTSKGRTFKNNPQLEESMADDHLEDDLYVFRSQMVAALKVFFGEYMQMTDLPKKTEPLDQKMNELRQKMTGPEDPLLEEEYEYHSSKKDLLTLNFDFLSQRVNLYSSMISENLNKRPSVSDVLRKMAKMKTDFKKAVTEIMKKVSAYESKALQKGDSSMANAKNGASVPFEKPSDLVEMKKAINDLDLASFSPLEKMGQHGQKRLILL